MGKTGLLERAARLRTSFEASATQTGTIPVAGFDTKLGEGSGIDADDRREILEAIDKVASSNRISAGPESFVLKPRRRGLLFPLLVNLAALVLTAAAVLGLKEISARREAAVVQSGTAVSTAEGRLLQELKRESDSKLQEKDKAISDIQNRLLALDKERGDLASSMEERVKRREADLKAELAAALEKERQRLGEQGLSEIAIQERLKRLEAEKSAALRRELETFQKQSEAEKKAAEERFARLRDEYQASIASLVDDRKRIQDEASRRESELRSSLEAKARELESQSAEAKADLAQARSELARLQAQKDRDDAVEDRIIGLYGSIKAALRDRSFAAAADGAAALSAYLNEPAVAQSPALQSRRETDLFAADALGALARAEIARTGADATKLLNQAELLAAARNASTAASKALRAGDVATAQAKYREALEKIPEILAAHEFFLGRLREEETARLARLKESLSLADSAYRAGDTATASLRYAEVLEYLPIDEATRRTLAARFGQVSISMSEKARREADTKAARDPLSAARKDLAAERWAAALHGYVGVLAAFPLAEQAIDAQRGVASALEGMEANARAKAEADARTIADLGSEMNRLKAESEKNIAERDTERAKLVAEADDKDARIAKLEELLSKAQRESAGAAAAASAASPAAAQAAKEGDITALKAEVDRLSVVAAKYDRITSSYAEYASAEDSALAAGGPGSLVDARTKLEAFLGAAELREVMPGFRDRISRYERAYQEAGQREVLYNALDLVDGAIRAKDSDARERYFSDLEQRYADAPAMLDFLKGLRKSIR